jgi:PAS domain S-box-containing protein
MIPDNTKWPSARPSSAPRRNWLYFPRPVAWVVLAIALAASAGMWFIAWNHTKLAARKRFDEEAGRIAAALSERMQVYEDVLHGAAGLFAASSSVEREEWRAYLQSVSIEKRFPGIDGVGFEAYVPRAELQKFLDTTRADRTPGFSVKEPGATNDLLIIKYIEPEERHRAMVGSDMGVDPEPRAVAERARDTGLAALSGMITMQVEGRGRQAGCLMVLPVYRHGLPTDTKVERQAAIEGWVFARFIAAQLMQEVMGGNHPWLHLRILDADASGSDNLVFDEDPKLTASRPQEKAWLLMTIPAEFGGRAWTLSFATKPSFEADRRRGASLGVGAAAGLISLLLFGIAWSLSHTRERALAMAADMTRTLRETNDWLEHERFLLRTLMDNVPEHIYFKDRQSRFLRNNQAHLRSFGLAWPEEAIGKSDSDFFSEEHARQALEDEQRVMASGKSITKEEKETWPDGSVTWALTTKMPLRDESGQIVGTFGISRNITDRKLAEEAMRLGKEAAEEASRTKSQFLASMSHELRTPLNSVIGFANILLKNKAGTLGPAELNFLDRIQANGKHLLTLINEILDLSKIEARKVELNIGPVALDLLVRETVAQQESLVRDKPVQLLEDLPAKVAPILSDAEKLRQVLINLIGNALKFTEQGSVTVRVVTDPADHHPTCLEVIDTGIGIPQEKLGVIFEAFQQAEAGTARKYEGTGLGLTISQALCQLMGYRIDVSSQPGRGSTFSVRLAPSLKAVAPAALAPAPVAEAAPATAAVGLKGKLVLVIDDELDSRTLLTHAIEEFGCQAIASSSGEQGLRMAREFRPQLITVDLMMPQLDGWQVIRAIKADPALRNIPVVVVSIVASENRGRILGAVDVLQKPISRAELLAVLHRCLPLANPRILMVDDDDDSRRVLAALLEDEAYEFRAASNGREAAEIMEKFLPDLVLLDLIMPVMDGMTFLNLIRSNPRFQFLPVVVVTAKELTLAESERLRQTAQDVVQKGDTFEADLNRVLRRFLRGDAQAATGEKP